MMLQQSILILLLLIQQSLSTEEPLIAEREDQNSSEIRVRRGEMRPVVYKFTHPAEDIYDFIFTRSTKERSPHVTECEGGGFVRTSANCSSDGNSTIQYIVLLIDGSAEAVNGTSISCGYRLNMRIRPCQNRTDFEVIVYEGMMSIPCCARVFIVSFFFFAPEDIAPPPENITHPLPENTTSLPPENVTCPPPEEVTCPPPEIITWPPPENVTCPPPENITCRPPENVTPGNITHPLPENTTCPPPEEVTCPPCENITCPSPENITCLPQNISCPLSPMTKEVNCSLPENITCRLPEGKSTNNFVDLFNRLIVISDTAPTISGT